MYQEYGQFTREITGKGKFLGGNQLMPIASATTVRMRGGKRVVTDGSNPRPLRNPASKW